MNIHEYQAKELLKGYNVPTVPGFLALNPDEAINAAEKILIVNSEALLSHY